MSTKTNIKNFGKTFQYLDDPELRHKQTSDALLNVKDALFSGAQFRGQTWRSVKFVNCDFVGVYEIKLQAIEHCTFENCRFAGIFDFGVMNDVQFYKCESGGTSNWGGQTHSKNVVFKECQFIGEDPDRNRQGAIGTYGEAAFLNCKIKWFDIVGDSGLFVKDCVLEDVSYHPNVDRGGAHVLIENSKLRGLFNMVPARLLSLTIRDTVLDNLDLSGATVKGDVVIERVRGGCIDAYVKEARSLSVRHSQIYGNGQKIFEAYAGGIRSIEIDTVIFGGDFSTEPVSIAGGTGADLSNVRARVNDSIVIRKSKVPRLSTHHVNTASYRLESCEMDSLDLSDSRIGVLELIGNTIARNVDLTGTQVRDSKVQTLAKGQAKLDGSNVKVN